jgi:regulator of protease activity HflC (stomatin/prohibitin superfamily)
LAWAAVETFFQNVLCDAVISVSASHDLHWMIWDKDNGPAALREAVWRAYGKRLGRYDLGISVELELLDITTPRQVKDAFDQAASSGLQAERQVARARAQASEIINQARADELILLARAQAYQTQVVQGARSDADYLDSVQQSVRQTAASAFADDPVKRRDLEQRLLAVTVDELYQETLRSVLGGTAEVFVLDAPDTAQVEWRPMLSRDAEMGKKIRQRQEQRRENREIDIQLERPSEQ